MTGVRDRSDAGAFLALWNSIDSAELQAEYETWHTFEHVPERVGMPGFIEARRYRELPRREGAPPGYFTCYWLDSREALSTARYRDVVANPTPWSARMRPHLRSFFRLPCELRGICGNSTASKVVTLRMRPRSADVVAHLALDLARQVAAAGLVGAQWGDAQPDDGFPMSNAQTDAAAGDVVVMLDHIDFEPLRQTTHGLVQALAALAAPVGEPAFFELLSVVCQRDLEFPPTARQPAKPDLLARFVNT